MLGANKKKKVSEFATPYTVGNALTKGGATVKLSALVMGLANMPDTRTRPPGMPRKRPTVPWQTSSVD